MPHEINDEMRRCIEACDECRRVCLETVSHCLQKGGRHAAPEHIVLMLDCADICGTSSSFMARGSHEHGQVCGVCAEICSRCADDCERLGDDEAMRRCAQVCRTCAQQCERMAGVTASR